MKLCACVSVCRKDSFITHRAFCDALAEESARLILANQQVQLAPSNSSVHHHPAHLITSHHHSPSGLFPFAPENPNSSPSLSPALQPQHTFPSLSQKSDAQNPSFPVSFPAPPPPPLSNYFSATALLQKATAIGATTSTQMEACITDHMAQLGMSNLDVAMKVSPEYCLGFGTPGNLGNLLTSDSSKGEITRDFLGLRGEAQRHNTDRGGEGSSLMVMKPHGLVRNFGLVADHPAITNAATTFSRLWG